MSTPELDEEYLRQANVPEGIEEVLPPEMRLVKVPIASLRMDPDNARRGDSSSIAESVDEFGVHRAVVVRKATKHIVVGNHLVKALQSMGQTHVDVLFVDDDEIKAMRRGIADNTTGDLATWSIPQLAVNAQITGIDIPGMTDALAAKIEAELRKGMPDAQEEPEKPTYPIVPEFGEKHGAVVIVFKDEAEWAFLQTVLRLERASSYKCGATGIPQVLTAVKFGEIWRDYARQLQVPDDQIEQIQDAPDPA